MKKAEKKEKNNSASCEERKKRTQRLIANAKNSLLGVEKEFQQILLHPLPNQYLQQEAIERTQSTILLLQERIKYLETELLLIRESIDQDIEYRQNLLIKYPELAKRLAIRNKSLRFHGAPLIASLKIIASGTISSSQERGMGQVSFDGSGQISVTDLRSIVLSIKDYTGIKDHHIPMGCLFVLTPQNRADARAIRSYLMKSIQLKGQGISKRFIAVLCTPETLPIIKTKLKNNGYPESLALDYFEFLNRLQ